MIKKLISIFLLSLAAGFLSAQNTTVNMTVTDTDGTVWKNGTWSISFVPNPSQPNIGIYNINGIPLNQTLLNQTGVLNSSGVGVITVIDNSLITPSGSQWNLRMCPNASAPCGIYNFPAAGGSMNISAALTAIIPPPRFKATQGSYGYNSNEALIQVAGGSTYYDVNMGCQNFYNNVSSTWACPGGSGSSPAGSQFQLQYYLDSSHFGAGLATGDANGNISASINTQFNVLMFGAKGDCVTDDHNAIQAAMSAALAFTNNTSTSAGPAAVYFPKTAAGKCYLTSTLQWVGVPLIGQPSGINIFGPGIIIQGMPGQDILHAQDPSVVPNSPFYVAWTIRDITFKVDDSVNATASFPHRFPGRWFDDGAITSGSAVFTSLHARIDCGDVGQAIQVNGAGPAGGNLVTTIASVFPCWNQQNAGFNTVTLAASASTTVSNAHSYISVNGLPVTTTIGNAAIAMDNSDSNQADWPTPISGGSGLYPRMENVFITSTSGLGTGQNGSAGYFTQGHYGQYGIHVDFMNIQHIQYAIAQVCSDINSFQSACANDYQVWHHMDLVSQHPWISYNGGSNHLSDIQLCSDNSMMFLTNQNSSADFPVELNFDSMGQECATTNNGMRYNGAGAVFNSIDLSTSPETAFINSFALTCTNCKWSALQLGGAHNIIYPGGLDETTASTVDVGRDNSIILAYQSNPQFGMQVRKYVLSPMRNPGWYAGAFSPYGFQDGNTSTFYSREDLLMTAADAHWNTTSALTNYLAYDTNSPSGAYIKLNNTFNIIPHMNVGTAFSSQGSHVPLGNVTMFVTLLCVGGTTANLSIANQVGATVAGPLAITCSTTVYQTFTIRGNVTVASQNIGPKVVPTGTTTEVRYSWDYMRPDVFDINGLTVPSILNTANLGLTPGPNTGTTAGHVAIFSNTTGQIADSGLNLPNLVADTTLSIPSFAIPGNTCYGSAGSTTPGTLTMPNLTTSMVVKGGYTTNPSTIAGWGTTGGFSLAIWPSAANTASYVICNPTSGSITGGAITFNIGAL